ncbi:MAG TPA: 16S rRNA methyltransferase [Devosia sp.]|nr:16S rRNA methyltransferase [Devosia sp.]
MESELEVDFLGGAVAHRFRFGGGRGQALARAVGLKPEKTPKIVDATAGLGRDAFLLASLGAEVTLIERSARMHRLLEQGLERAAAAGGEIAPVIARMKLIHADAIELLPELSPQIIVVDPMHPERKGSALVKKQLRQVRKIVGTDEDAAELMQVALASASRRVVLKWPQKAAPMPGLPPPSHQITGKSTRYDVFMIQNM